MQAAHRQGLDLDATVADLTRNQPLNHRPAQDLRYRMASLIDLRTLDNPAAPSPVIGHARRSGGRRTTSHRRVGRGIPNRSAVPKLRHADRPANTRHCVPSSDRVKHRECPARFGVTELFLVVRRKE